MTDQDKTETPRFDLASIKRDSRTLVYVSDGTAGADKVLRLLKAIPVLVDALEEAAKHMEDMADSLDDSITRDQVHEQLLIGMRAAQGGPHE